ncbi:MAG: universal stress protein [Phycisphaeraceae bacterium]|nr:universal stress protein [Phycisphaeraceae bacterium]
MITRIIVAYDGSEPSRAAFTSALGLAQGLGTRMLAVHLIEPTIGAMLAACPDVGLDPMIPAMPLPPMIMVTEESDIREAQAQMEPLAKAAAAAGVAFESKVEQGTVEDWLLRTATVSDLMVVGMKGRFARSGVGSTTRALVTNASCPVMVHRGEGATPKRLLGVFDGTPRAESAVGLTRSLAAKTGWPTTILAAARGKASLEENVARATALAGTLPVEGLPGGSDAGSPGSAVHESAAIQEAVSAKGGGYLVAGAYANSVFRDLFLRNPTSELLSAQAAGGPVILVHADVVTASA